MWTVAQTEPNEWRFLEHTESDAIREGFDEALDYMDAGNLDLAEKLLRKTLADCPWHIDAIHHLGLLFFQTDRKFEARLCAQEGVRIGLSAIPKEFSWHTARLPWLYLSNRPFLRAYHSLGIWYLRDGAISCASDTFARLLSINPNDNQGARALLMQCHISLADWKSAITLSNLYEKDHMPDMIFGRALALIEDGRTEEGVESLNSACNSWPLVAKELLKTRHEKPESIIDGCLSDRGPDQAYDYWERNGTVWKRSTTAIKLLSKKMKSPQRARRNSDS